MEENQKVFVQNEAFLYNDNIQKIITNMPLSNNVLQKYDNVTFNACLYMFSRDAEEQIEKDSFNGEIKFGDTENKKVVIAQTGKSAKFSIDSIKIQTIYGGNTPINNCISYKMNIKLVEVLSCMFVNELEIVSYLIGYRDYLHRPYWLDIWFSGYDPESLLPVEYIPLPNGKDRITYRGIFSNVKSDLQDNHTNWNIEFYPNNHTFINKNNNILAISPIIKSDSPLSMAEYMSREAEKAKKRFIETFPGKSLQKSVEDLFNGDNKFLEIEIVNGDDLKSNNSSNYGETIKSGDGYSREVDKLEASENKNDEGEVTFLEIPQWFLARSQNHKDCKANIDIKTKLIGSVNKREIYSTKMTIVVFRDIAMKHDLEKYKNDGRPQQFIEDEKTNFLASCLDKGTFCKKYIYGFSGKDTSVTEVMNNLDHLWYMNGYEYDLKRQSESNINLLYKNEEKNHTFYLGDNYSLKVNGNANFGLLEDLYENIKNEVNDLNIKKFNFPVLNNDLDSIVEKNTSQSDNKEEDNETKVSINSYKRLYKSGQLSTTKFKILGDPYWLLTISDNAYNPSNTQVYMDSIRTKYYMSDNYRCVFGVKNFIGQDTGLEEDYTYEYSMMVSGIYCIYKCESELSSEGTFYQTLYGTLDTHFIDYE